MSFFVSQREIGYRAGSGFDPSVIQPWENFHLKIELSDFRFLGTKKKRFCFVCFVKSGFDPVEEDFFIAA